MQSQTLRRTLRSGTSKTTDVAAKCSLRDKREAAEIVRLELVVEQKTTESELLHDRVLKLESALENQSKVSALKKNANAREIATLERARNANAREISTLKKARNANALQKNANARKIANLQSTVNELASKLKEEEEARNALHAKLIETKRRVGIRWGSIMKCVAWLTFLGAGVRRTPLILKAVASTQPNFLNAHPLTQQQKLRQIRSSPSTLRNPNGMRTNNYKAQFRNPNKN